MIEFVRTAVVHAGIKLNIPVVTEINMRLPVKYATNINGNSAEFFSMHYGYKRYLYACSRWESSPLAMAPDLSSTYLNHLPTYVCPLAQTRCACFLMQFSEQGYK